jgi:uncharacterized membrane protein
MPAEPLSGVPAPEWEYLLAHHVPGRYCRTLEVRLRGRTLHFCARCSGELVGFVAFLGLFLASASFAALTTMPLAGVVLAVCPAPAWLDWVTQTVRSRESSNALRVTSGALLGAALGGLVAFGWHERWVLFGAGLGIVGSYLGLAMGILARTGAWRRVVAEHFP